MKKQVIISLSCDFGDGEVKAEVLRSIAREIMEAGIVPFIEDENVQVMIVPQERKNNES